MNHVDDQIRFKDALFEWNYDFMRRYLGKFGLFSAVMMLVFYGVLDQFAGFHENFYIRLVASLMCGSWVFLPKLPKKLDISSKTYIEITIAFSLPFLFTYHLVTNGINTYWMSSMIFCGFLAGLLSHQIIGLVSFILVVPITALLFAPQGAVIFSEANLLLSFLLSFAMQLFAGVIRTMIQLSFKTSLQLSIQRHRSEQMVANFNKLKKREELIKRFVRPSLITELSMGKDPLQYNPRNITTSILFIDMRNYTRLSEANSLEKSHELLNESFETINSCVFKNNGEVDKIMGDAVMATFLDPEDCLRACIEMRKGLSDRNRKRAAEGKQTLKFGTGISFGEVLSANFGSPEKFDRTIVGDIVNVGARLEQLTKGFKLDILATKDFVEKTQDPSIYRLVDFAQVKGKSHSVEVYEIFSHNHPDVIEYKQKTRETLGRAIKQYVGDDMIEALGTVRKMIEECPPHRLFQDSILDPYLYVLEEKIKSKIGQEYEEQLTQNGTKEVNISA